MPWAKGKPVDDPVAAVICIECGLVSIEPPDSDIECCWKGPNWQRVLITPQAAAV